MYLRSYLLTLRPDEDPEETSLRTILTTAVHYVFLSYPPPDAVYHVSSLGQAVDLANAKAQQSLFNRYTADLREVAEYLVESFNVPSPGSDNTLYDPQVAIGQIRVFRSGESSASLTPFSAQGKVISAWGLVEQALKLALGFYTLHFSQYVPPGLGRCFEEATKKKSIGPIVQSLRVVEKIFREGEPAKERKDRQNKLDMGLEIIQEERDKTREGLKQKSERLKKVQWELARTSDKTEANELKEEARGLQERIAYLQKHADFLEKSIEQRRKNWQQEEEAIQREAGQRARTLQAECLAYFGRESPFSGLDLEHDFPHELGSLYRNDFAHSPGDQVVEDEKVSKSLREAERIIVELVKKRIVPKFIRLVGQGIDTYGRRTLQFVEERWMTLGGKFDPGKLRWFYPSSKLEYEPFQCLLMIEPGTDKTLKDKTRKEPIIEPVVYTLEEIASVIY